MSLVLLEKWTPWTLKYDMTLLYVHSLIRPLVLVIATWIATTQTHTGKTWIIWSKMAYSYIITFMSKLEQKLNFKVFWFNTCLASGSSKILKLNWNFDDYSISRILQKFFHKYWKYWL